MKLAGKTLYQEKEIGMTNERKAYLTNNPSGTRGKIVVAKGTLFRLFQKFNVLLGYFHGTKRRKKAIARLGRRSHEYQKQD